MKKKIFSLLIAMVAAATSVQAQQISVVSPSGATSLYRTLPEAIEGAQGGSVVYLPGGQFETSSNILKISKKLTIMGIGRRIDKNNPESITKILGTLIFDHGSDGSAVMGCSISGGVNIGTDAVNGQVNDVMIKHCIVNGDIKIRKTTITGTIISQNCCLGDICFGKTTSGFYDSGSGVVKNNIITGRIQYMNTGVICNNILLYSKGQPLYCIESPTITGNVFMYFPVANTSIADGNSSCNATLSHATLNREWGNDPITFQAESWDDVFVNYNNTTISPASNFHFKDEYKQYESQVGIYAGEGFDDNQMAPVPYIMYKDVPDKTDAEGKLKVRIRVKANQ